MEFIGYTVTEVESNKKHLFKSVKKAKQFIENWGIENDHHTGKVDIDSKTILWQVGTYKKPIIQFEKTFGFNQ